MKHLFFIAFFVSFWQVSIAQKALFYQTPQTFSFGPRFGFNTSTLFFEQEEITAQQGIRLNWNGGIWTRYQISQRWGVQLNADYAPRGSKQYKLNYIDVPLTMVYNVRYKMFKMPFTFDVYLGVQPSFLTKATWSTAAGDSDVTDQFRGTTADLVFGSGFPMGRFLFYTTNKINLSKLQKSSSPQIRRGWSSEWFVGYRFGSSNMARLAQPQE